MTTVQNKTFLFLFALVEFFKDNYKLSYKEIPVRIFWIYFNHLTKLSLSSFKRFATEWQWHGVFLYEFKNYMLIESKYEDLKKQYPFEFSLSKELTARLTEKYKIEEKKGVSK